MSSKPRPFLDTSALFAGIWSETGGARMILKLGEAGAVRILINPQVLKETDDVVRRKAPDQLRRLALLMDRCQMEVIDIASSDILQHCLQLTSHTGDARIITDAWVSGCDFFVTLDRLHFLDNSKLREGVPFPMGTPGDFLEWFRNLKW